MLVVGLRGGSCAAAGSAAAGERLAYGGPVTTHERAAYIAVGDADARADRLGRVLHRATSRNATTKPSTPRDVVLTPKAWSDMVKVNAWVNDNIKPITDLEHWGVVERGIIPTTATATARTMCCSSGAC